jgi:hypothetical protein
MPMPWCIHRGAAAAERSTCLSHTALFIGLALAGGQALAGPVPPSSTKLWAQAGSGIGEQVTQFVGGGYSQVWAQGSASGDVAQGSASSQASVAPYSSQQHTPAVLAHSIAKWSCCTGSEVITAASLASTQHYARLVSLAPLPSHVPIQLAALPVPLLAFGMASTVVIDGAYASLASGYAKSDITLEQLSSGNLLLDMHSAAYSQAESGLDFRIGFATALLGEAFSIKVEAAGFAYANGPDGGESEGLVRAEVALDFDQFAFDDYLANQGLASFDLQKYFAFEFSETPTPVPEPATWLLLLAGLGLVQRQRVVKG